MDTLRFRDQQKFVVKINFFDLNVRATGGTGATIAAVLAAAITFHFGRIIDVYYRAICDT